MPPKPEKLLNKMRQSAANWKRREVITLYEGYGFRLRHGGKHDVVFHPNYPELRDVIPRHRKVPQYIVKNAIKIVDKLIELQDTTDS